MRRGFSRNKFDYNNRNLRYNSSNDMSENIKKHAYDIKREMIKSIINKEREFDSICDYELNMIEPVLSESFALSTKDLSVKDKFRLEIELEYAAYMQRTKTKIYMITLGVGFILGLTTMFVVDFLKVF